MSGRGSGMGQVPPVPATPPPATVHTAAPITGDGSVGSPISIPAATDAVNGYMTATDHEKLSDLPDEGIHVSAPLTGDGSAGTPLGLSIGTGLSLDGSNNLQVNLSVGVAGGQTAIGGTLTGQGLTLRANLVDVSYARLAALGFGVAANATPPVNLGGTGYAFTISAATTGDAIGRMELQGSRTGNTSFALFDFYHQANRCVRLAAIRANSSDTTADFSFSVANAGVLATAFYVNHDSTLYFGQAADQTSGVYLGPGNVQAFGAAAPGVYAAGRTTGTTSNGDVLATLAGFNTTHQVGKIEVQVAGAANNSGALVLSTANAGALAVALKLGPTGTLQIGSGASVANGSAVIAVSNLGPAGVTTATIKKWLNLVDSDGVTQLYIPAWGA